MPHRHTPSSEPHGHWLLGPRALAVLSCALAMLAANPAMASSRQSQTAGVVSTLDHLPSTSITSAVAAPTGTAARSRKTSRLAPQPAVANPALGAPGDSQVLKALAHWSNLLTRQLASLLNPHQHLAFIQANELSAPQTPRQINAARRVQTAGPLPCSHESLFAIGHCLLSPPSRA
jgi:hypothetical protein